ncbi:MAG: response regulator [Candidatus Latescibacteria bacterium]|nr:response regulator [Candidatus Latescibacterota bacterium]
MPPANAHTILIVDDEPHILSALRRLLAREGYLILTATSGAQGLELLQDNAVSLIISDQRMPVVIGAEFLGRARLVSPHSMRLILTGYAEVEAAAQAVNEGGIHFYLRKPWDDGQLRLVVQQLLDRFDLEEHNRQLTEELLQKNEALHLLNSELEERVRERTQALSLKVRELEGRDRIAQHLLTVHTLEETLGLVVEVISEVLGFDRAVIYLEEEVGGMRPVVAIGLRAKKGVATTGAELAGLEPGPVHRHAFAQVTRERRPLRVMETGNSLVPPFAVVPVLRGDELLGLIEVDKRWVRQPVSEEELAAVASFALQAAVAIRDAQLQQTYHTWKGQLDEVLREAGPLDALGSP